MCITGTSEFAPASCQKSLSYFVGWLSALGWQASIALTSFAAGNVILELASAMHPTYTPALWHGTLMTILMAVLAVMVNTLGAKHLPLLEATILFLHVFGFFAVLTPLWVIAPKISAKEAFTSFSNTGGWSSIGAAVVIGQLTAVGSLGGRYGHSVNGSTANVSKDLMPQPILLRKLPMRVMWSLESCLRPSC
jgi:choline transport protein